MKNNNYGKRICTWAFLFLLGMLVPASAQTDTLTMDNDTYHVEWLKTETFDHDSWSDHWTVESQGPKVFAEDGLLKVRLVDDNRKEAGVTIWYNEDLPADVAIEVKASTDAQVENNACNLNFFVHASEANGSPLAYGRSGGYTDYHQIPNYLFTLTGGITPGWARARLDPGFQLISERADIRSSPGQTYVFLIIIQANRIQYYLNGEKLHDYTVESPLPGGRFGLRTWFSQVNYEQVRIGRVLP